MMSLRRSAWLVLALTASACATSVETPFGEELEPQASAERGNSRLIVRAELDEIPGRSVYEAIERLRARWLRPGRAGTISTGPVYARVVIDNAFPGDIDQLRSINTEAVERIAYLSAAEATTKYGTGYLGGVIEVTSRIGS